MNHKKKRKRIVFFGDSLTEFATQSKGYIKRLLAYIKSEGLDDKYELVGAGIAGNKVTDLYNRLDKDVLENGAEMVVIYIGINDIWHKLDGFEKGTDIETFKTVYEEIIGRLEAASIKVILCTPSVIGEKINLANLQDDDLEMYSEIVRELAVKYDLQLVDLRKAFLNFNLANNIEDREEGVLTTDSVHLNNKGNELVAEEMWKVLQQVM